MFFKKGDGRVISLRTRLVVSTVAAVALALAVGFIWARRNLHDVLVEQIDETLVNKNSELSAVASQGVETLDQEMQREIEVYERVDMTVRVDVDDGRTLIAPDDADGRQRAKRIKDVSRDVRLQTIQADDRFPSFRIFSGPVSLGAEKYGAITIAISLERSYETLRLFDRRVLLGGAMLLVIAVPTGLWLYRQALRPVTKAVRAARRLDPKDMTARLPVTGAGDELDQLSHVINELLAKLQLHHGRVTQFTADASHELRTPLAAMKTSIDVALQRRREAGDYRVALESLGDQCDRLTAIVEKLQWLARADAGKLEPKLERVDVATLVRETVEFLAPLAEEKGVSLKANAIGEAMVVGDVAYLRQVFVNLIDNAVKFTPAGGAVAVSVRDDGAIVSTIEDTGIGISESDAKQLFERFYRSNETRSLKGSGLGLSICKSIVEAHGGEIDAAARTEGGSVFRVSLPRAATVANARVVP